MRCAVFRAVHWFKLGSLDGLSGGTLGYLDSLRFVARVAFVAGGAPDAPTATQRNENESRRHARQGHRTMSAPTVLIMGASARPAAFSALRAGLRPWAIDLFADRDLAAACPARAIPPGRFPAGFADLAREAPPGPWLYTGGPENHPRLVGRIARERPLWGNGPAALVAARDPFALARAFRAAGLPCPAVRRPAGPVPAGRWLVKPRAGAGGIGIRHTARDRPADRGTYLQEFIDGEARAALFVADTAGCRLLGVTRQLVGEDWLHARPFRYCGGVGPLPVAAADWAAWERLGGVVAAVAGLRGLFGVDAIVRDGVPWPVEVNP